MPLYPYNTNLVKRGQTDAGPAVLDTVHSIVHRTLTALQAATKSATAVHAAVTDNGAPQVVTTAITNPPAPRNISATAGGTNTDIKAIQVIVAGTDEADQAITETLPAFTVDTAGVVVGNKAFKTVTSITIPAHDGTGATTSVGFDDKIGLPDKLAHNTVVASVLNNVRETTAATVAVDATNLSGNTAKLNSALNGTVVDIYYIV